MDVITLFRQLSTFGYRFVMLFLLMGLQVYTDTAVAQQAVSDSDTTKTVSVAFPLFDEDEPLELMLEMDLNKVLNDRGDDPREHPLKIQLTDPGSELIVLEAQVRVRGNSRKKRSNCTFPPLRLNLKKDHLEGTVFDGQDKVKLVTHCRTNRSAYEQNVLQEYLIYKTYNLFTEKSFRVRLLRITYKDERGKTDPFIRYGFLIEDEDHLAERLGSRILDVNNVHPDQTDREVANILSVFQFMIGNTDWSIPGLHNTKLIMPAGGGVPAPVPYDFDLSGIVDTPYAKPSPILNISSVRDRVFRGFCQSPGEYQKAFAEFNRLKDSIYRLYEDHSPPLEENEVNQSLSYLDDFYDIINDERKSNRRIIEACRTDR